jgi:xanthine dehydrogenase small subunit
MTANSRSGGVTLDAWIKAHRTIRGIGLPTDQIIMISVLRLCNNESEPVFSFLLNGETVRVETVSPQTTLLDFIRARGLTGAKEGCAEGECGACTVVMVKDHGEQNAYRPVNSCLMFLPMAAGQEVYTVEALAAGGELNAVQSAMAAAGGSQCGYCTPGFVMSLFAEYYRPGRTGGCDPHALGGNLCRCTGYRPIRDAALSLGAAPDDGFQRRLSRVAPEMQAMSYHGFSRPATLAECIALLKDPAARIVAGGTDMAVEANLRGSLFPRLVSVEALRELRVFRDTAEHVELGAALTLSEVGLRWKDAPEVVSEWLPLFASLLIRNRATLGGNLGTASPIGDAAPMLLALDASVRIANEEGERAVPLSSFFLDYRKTALARGEVLVSVIVPKPFPAIVRFYKAAKRKLDDISTVAACFALDLDRDQRVRRARFCYGGVAAVPRRVIEAEESVAGRLWDEGAVARARDAVGSELKPLTDHRGSAEYRLALAQSLIGKFYAEAVA